MKKGSRITLIVLELLSLAAIAVGMTFTFLNGGTAKIFFEYSTINAVFAAIIAFFSICFLLFSKKEKEIGAWFWGIKLIGAVSSLMLIVLSFAFSYPIANPSDVDWGSFVKDGPLYLVVCLPLLSLASFLAATPKRRKANIFAFALLGTVIPIAYIAFVLVYKLFIDKAMFDAVSLSAKAYLSPSFVNNDALKPEIVYTLYLAGCVLVSYLLSLLLSLDVKKAVLVESSVALNEAKIETEPIVDKTETDREKTTADEEKSEKQCESPTDCDIQQSTNVEETPEKTEDKKEENDEKPKQKDVAPVKKEKSSSTQNSKVSKYGDGARVYHISKQSDGIQWQVKLATGKKPIKLFKTQAEAIDFAKRLTKTQGGSIRIHSVKGRMRKGG